MRKIKFLFILLLSFNLCACTKFKKEESNIVFEEEIKNLENNNEDREKNMKLHIDDKLVPVIWCDNETTKAIKEEIENKDMVVEMSMYGGNEQYGYLGKTYPSNNSNITTSCGDIVLYDDENIVVFYGSNTWFYTKLGKIDLDNKEIVDLLSKDNVTLRLNKD